MKFKKPKKPKRRVSVDLVSIDFRWSGSDASNSSLAIFPKTSGWSMDHRSELAYSMEDTAENAAAGKMEIRARFKKSEGDGYVQIRAIPIPINPKDIPTGEFLKSYPSKKALGNIEPKHIFFSESGYSIYRGKYTRVPLKLKDPQYINLGVGIYDVNWAWEFRTLSRYSTKENPEWEKHWRKITITKHRLYVTLKKPQFPWTPNSLPDFSKGAPFPSPVWDDALHAACFWARGAKTENEAAKMIADALFDSGKFEYDTDSSYHEVSETNPMSELGLSVENKNEQKTNVFHLSKVLERLGGGHGLGKDVNCLDCALIVSTLSNILGCKLRVGKLQQSPSTDYSDPEIFNKNRFAINPIKAIGKTSVAQTMEGLAFDNDHYFSYHAVAWSGEIDENIPEDGVIDKPDVMIYDACVRFDNGADEDGKERTTAATCMPLVGQDEHSYRYRLSQNKKGGIDACKLQASTVIRIQLQ